MSEPTIKQLRAWQRRAETAERSMRTICNEMMALSGEDFMLAGENMSTRADDVAECAALFASYLEFCAELLKRPDPTKES